MLCPLGKRVAGTQLSEQKKHVLSARRPNTNETRRPNTNEIDVQTRMRSH